MKNKLSEVMQNLKDNIMPLIAAVFIIPNLKRVRRDRRLMNEEMNIWLNDNNITEVINIESLEYELPVTMGSLPGVKFHGFRVWYKTQA